MLILNYQEHWPADFEKISSILLEQVAKIHVQIEHVGSTAVAGLSAKPIIDIDLIYFDQKDFDQIKTELEKLGYYHNGDQGITGREVFKRMENRHHPILDSIRHHLYVCHLDSEELKRHLAFRDHLRQNPESRQQYVTIKNEIAKEVNQDKKKYAILKEIRAKKFINTCIENQIINGK